MLNFSLKYCMLKTTFKTFIIQFFTISFKDSAYFLNRRKTAWKLIHFCNSLYISKLDVSMMTVSIHVYVKAGCMSNIGLHLSAYVLSNLCMHQYWVRIKAMYVSKLSQYYVNVKVVYIWTLSILCSCESWLYMNTWVKNCQY